MKRRNHPLSARIKRLMQADEDVGKISQATPILIGRALELFLHKLCSGAHTIAQARQAKTLTPAHIKASVLSDTLMDFLKDTVGKAPDLGTEAEATTGHKLKRQRTMDSTDFAAPATRGRGRGRGRGAGGRAKPTEDGSGSDPESPRAKAPAAAAAVAAAAGAGAGTSQAGTSMQAGGSGAGVAQQGAGGAQQGAAEAAAQEAVPLPVQASVLGSYRSYQQQDDDYDDDYDS